LNREDITPDLVRRLVAAQFPQWAELPVDSVALDGWDNRTFRLGDSMSVRLPSGDAYALQVEKEQRWLPWLRDRLPLQIPEPVGQGQPSAAFPRPWSVYRWIEGTPASEVRIADMERFAIDLAAFLSALYAADTTVGPPPGRHSSSRGAHVRVWDTQTGELLEKLEGRIDTAGAKAVWQTAVTAPPEGTASWVHGDVTGSNLLVRGGRLSAVIDFGCCAVGDPACDLTVAWTFFGEPERSLFKSLLPLDAGAWARARGWALWKALLHLAQDPRRFGSAEEAGRRVGWRFAPEAIVESLIEEVR
jgi:aminoglycoside phosphotransferase (APT) family kinase protein